MTQDTTSGRQTYTMPTEEFYRHYKPIQVREQELANQGLHLRDIAHKLTEEGFTSFTGGPITSAVIYQVRNRIPMYEAVHPVLFPKAKVKATVRSEKPAETPRTPEAPSAAPEKAPEAVQAVSGAPSMDLRGLNREQIIPVLTHYLLEERTKNQTLGEQLKDLQQQRNEQGATIAGLEKQIKELEFELGVKGLEIEDHLKTIETLKNQPVMPPIEDLTSTEKDALALSGFRI